MKIATVGPGEKGANMTERRSPGGHESVAFHTSKEAREASTATGADQAAHLEELVTTPTSPGIGRAIVRAGKPADNTSAAVSNQPPAALRNRFGGHAVTLGSGAAGMESLAPRGESA